jgi:hypothetical protein
VGRYLAAEECDPPGEGCLGAANEGSIDKGVSVKAIDIRQLQILRSGEESLIEKAESADLRPANDSWVVDLVAAEAAFLRDLVDGQLVLLQWEFDEAHWEAFARVRATRSSASLESAMVHLRLEGAEAMRPRDMWGATADGAQLQRALPA